MNNIDFEDFCSGNRTLIVEDYLYSTMYSVDKKMILSLIFMSMTSCPTHLFLLNSYEICYSYF